MELKLNRQVFNKGKFNETVDTTFSQLVDNFPPPVFDINLATTEDFFTLYNKFFFEIPKEGDINSHRFLFKESGDYINAELINEEIQALLGEIVTLRQENLELRQSQIEGLSIANGRSNVFEVDKNTSNLTELSTNSSQLNTLNI
jgi:hypothetical protein|tara:strand:+ start:7592 stop:8026 length:435 start_codon:yes stop_codon:yes gene_type:complete